MPLRHGKEKAMNRLWVRLSLAFGAMVLVGVAIFVLVSILATHSRVRQFFLDSQLQAPGGVVEELADYYQTNQSWDGVDRKSVV